MMVGGESLEEDKWKGEKRAKSKGRLVMLSPSGLKEITRKRISFYLNNRDLLLS